MNNNQGPMQPLVPSQPQQLPQPPLMPNKVSLEDALTVLTINKQVYDKNKCCTSKARNRNSKSSSINPEFGSASKENSQYAQCNTKACLPSNTKLYPKKHVKAITLLSGKELGETIHKVKKTIEPSESPKKEFELRRTFNLVAQKF